MITTILIVLVAVVVLIVIIAFLALHFLRADDRADDSDSFDDVAAESRNRRRSPAEPPREQVSDGPGGRMPRRPEPARAQAHGQWPNLQRRDDRPAGYRDRDTGPRPSAPDRRNGQSTGPRPAAASARPARSPKASAEAKTNSWDSLSDVDYWAELSADKPQVGPAAPASARPNGTARRPDGKPTGRPTSEGRPVQRADSGPIPGPGPAGSMPARPRPQSARAGVGPSGGRAPDAGQTEQFDVRAARSAARGNEPTTQSLAALARLSGAQAPAPPRPDTGQRPASSQRSSGPRPTDGQRGSGPRPSQSTGYPRTPAPLDDDPLTSPSFPAINTSDSRSYRSRRSTGAHSGPQTGPQPAAGRTGGFAEPTMQYPAQAPASEAQRPSSPVANPYGSFVSAPQPAYGQSYGNGQQADGSWQSGANAGYLPANGYSTGTHNGNGHNGNGHNGNGSAHNGNGHGYPAGDQHDVQGGYGGFDYQNLTYQDADYQQAQPTADGYAQRPEHAGQFDERGYRAPDLAYGQDGYQSYPGYGSRGR